MERRLEKRTAVAGLGDVRVEILGEGDEGCMPGRLVELSGSGARIECSQPIRPGSAIKLQWDDELWLAEAIHSKPGGGVWHVGLKVRQRLSRLAELRKLMAGLVGGPVPGAHAGSRARVGF